MHLQAQTVHELESEATASHGRDWRDPDFLDDFSNCRLLSGLSGVELSSRSVDFAGSEAALLPNHQQLAMLPDEEQGGSHSRRPA